MSIFESKETKRKDIISITLLISQILKYVRLNPIKDGALHTLREFKVIMEAIWSLTKSIYKAKWDLIVLNKKKDYILNKCIIYCFAKKDNSNINNEKTLLFTSLSSKDKISLLTSIPDSTPICCGNHLSQ